MKRFLWVFLLLCTVQAGQAQLPVGRLLVLTEGGFSVPGYTGHVAYPGGVYTYADTLSSFGNVLHLYMDRCRYLAVNGDGQVRRYDVATNERLDTFDVGSARQVWVYDPQNMLTVEDQQVLVTCSQPPYFRVYDYNTRQLLYSLDTTKVRAAAEGLVVRGDTAFIAVNGFGAGPHQHVVAIDLDAQDTLRTLSVAFNPNNLVLHDSLLYVQCLSYDAPPQGGLVVSVLNAYTFQPVRTDSTRLLSYGIWDVYGDSILFQNSDFSTLSLAAYRLATGIVDTTVLAGSFYASEVVESPTGRTLFLARTDFTSFGRVLRYHNLVLQDSTALPLAPRSLVWVPQTELDVCATTDLAETTAPGLQWAVYPNPASSAFTIQVAADVPAGSFAVLRNSTGQALTTLPLQAAPWQEHTVDAASLARGLYLLELHTPDGRFVKRVLLE
jgi:hypothetical protein